MTTAESVYWSGFKVCGCRVVEYDNFLEVKMKSFLEEIIDHMKAIEAQDKCPVMDCECSRLETYGNHSFCVHNANGDAKNIRLMNKCPVGSNVIQFKRR